MLAALALAACGPVLAQDGGMVDGLPPAGCRAPEHEGNPLLAREERIRQFESLGSPCLKQLLVECSAAASRELLDTGTAFACSLGYEALLRRGFNGNFQAMLAWWRSPERARLE